MAKIMTDTNKWDDPWFIDLEPSEKLLWGYLTDKCNQIGVFDFSSRIASFLIGLQVDMDKFIQKSGGRIVKLESGKVFITGYLAFQNPNVSEKCPAHKPIIRLLEETPEAIPYVKATLSDTLLNTLSSTLSNREQVIVKVIDKGNSSSNSKAVEEKKETRNSKPSPAELFEAGMGNTCQQVLDLWLNARNDAGLGTTPGPKSKNAAAEIALAVDRGEVTLDKIQTACENLMRDKEARQKYTLSGLWNNFENWLVAVPQTLAERNAVVCAKVLNEAAKDMDIGSVFDGL